MKNFFAITKTKIILLSIFAIDGLHISVGKIIDTSCGGTGYCLPAPGAIFYSIIGLILIPLKIFLMPLYLLIWPVLKIGDYYFSDCAVNTNPENNKCYLYSIFLFLFLIIVYYIYASLLNYILKKIKTRKNRILIIVSVIVVILLIIFSMLFYSFTHPEPAGYPMIKIDAFQKIE